MRRKRACFEFCLLVAVVHGPSMTVDIFDVNSGRWSTAVLSEARASFVATSLPTRGLAIFAGGWGGGS